MKAYSKRIGGIVLMTIGLIIFILLVKNMLKDFPIWFFGRDATAVIVENWFEKVDEDDLYNIDYQYYVRYRFTASNGEVIVDTSSVSANEWSGLGAGREVLITYSPLDPSNSRIDDSRYMPILLCSYIPFFILCWLGLMSGWRLLDLQLKNAEQQPWIKKDKSE